MYACMGSAITLLNLRLPFQYDDFYNYPIRITRRKGFHTSEITTKENFLYIQIKNLTKAYKILNETGLQHFYPYSDP